MDRKSTSKSPTLDLAVVGAGVAGTYVVHSMRNARPEWAIELFERSNRIGGRLYSVRPPGVSQTIELGGMRFLTDQPRVVALVDALTLGSRPFGAAANGDDRLVLRGRISAHSSDAGNAYDLAPEERGLSFDELLSRAFERLVPGVTKLAPTACVSSCQAAGFAGGRLSDVPIAEALASVLSAEGTRFVMDVFGYYSGINAFNAADLIPFMLANDPSAKARTLVDGMDAIPRSLAERFASAGGVIRLGHELVGVATERGQDGAVVQRLRFGNGTSVTAHRVVLAMPLPALEILATESPLLKRPDVDQLMHAVESWPATKLYLWYERAWWRDSRFRGRRLVTDLSIRKLFYFDDDATPGPAVLLAAYTDGPHIETWRALANQSLPGSPPPAGLIAEATRQLRLVHPDADVPPPLGSAFVLWGADAHECAWHFWKAGARSSEALPRMIQPDPHLAVFVCGEAWSRAQSWVEGALETSQMVCEALIARP